MKTEQEIQDQMDLAIENPRVFHGMNYADGVKYALEWVLGQNDTAPMED
jgi:hypothetical protein